MAFARLDPRMEQALSKRSTLFRWLEFVGGSEFTALSRLLHGMKLIDLISVPVSGLTRLGMVPNTARSRKSRPMPRGYVRP